jgi:tetratricopeptide (TPR) repeat protein
MGKRKGHGRHAPRGHHARRTVGGERATAAARPATSEAATRQRIGALLDAERWAEAQALLRPLLERHPADADLLRELAQTDAEQRDWRECAETCERLLAVSREEPPAMVALAIAYQHTGRPVLALRTLRRVLARWPDAEDAQVARDGIAALEPEVAAHQAHTGQTGEDGLETLALHEEALNLIERGDPVLARQTEERVLRRAPGYAPALNTISQSYAQEGAYAQAIRCARRVIERDPRNVHALGNLVRYLCLSGALDEARAAAEPLRALPQSTPETWVKQAEALTYLGDDAGVLAAYAAGRRAGFAAPEWPGSLGLHLAAVAKRRARHRAEARRLWEQALEQDPTLDLARDNLEDMDQPIDKQNGAWPYGLWLWLSPQAAASIRGMVDRLKARTDEEAADALAGEMRRIVARHPEIPALIPLLLDHGDLVARDFAVRLARAAATPELTAALRDFALDQRGPDELRMEAARGAIEGGAMSAGPTRLWLKGKWTELFLVAFEISDEPEERHDERVTQLMEESAEALRRREPVEAERLLRLALEAEPDAPDLLNNLAAAYSAQGRDEESAALTRSVFERHPDYFFARVNLATIEARDGHVERAKELLAPLLRQTKLHISEFRALCTAQLELALAEKDARAAGLWLDMWEAIEPESPALERWRLPVGWLRMMQRRRAPRRKA